MSSRQKGFGAIPIIIIILTIGLLLVGGWYVWQRQTENTSTPPNQQNPPSAATDTLHYQDEYVNFDYPKDWHVQKQHSFNDEYGAHLINLTAPVEPSLKAADAANANLRLKISILISKSSTLQSCREDCTVYHVDKLSPQFLTSAGALVVSDWASQGYAHVVEYTSSNAVEGQKKYDLGFAVDDAYAVRIYGGYVAENGVSGVKLGTDSDFWDSVMYERLKDIIETLSINIQRYTEE